jgi:hypothetical protein
VSSENIDVRLLQAEYEKLRKLKGGRPPGGDELEARVAALEKSLPEIKEKLGLILQKVEGLEKHNATKADLANTELSMLKWCIGTAIAMTGLACAITFGLTKLFAAS